MVYTIVLLLLGGGSFAYALWSKVTKGKKEEGPKEDKKAQEDSKVDNQDKKDDDTKNNSGPGGEE